MDNLYIYTAGTLSYLNKIKQLYMALNWREELEQWASDNNVKIFNPATTFLKEKNHHYSDKIIVQQNDFFLNACNLMVVQLDFIDYSPGTQYEMTTFKHMQKPVIAFGKEKHWSPHINSCISHQCDNIEDVIELINNMFLV